MQNWLAEAALSGYHGSSGQRIVIAGQTIDERGLGKRRRIACEVGRAVRELVELWRRPGRPAKPAIAPHESCRFDCRDRLPGLRLRDRPLDQCESTLVGAFVDDCCNARAADKLTFR